MSTRRKLQKRQTRLTFQSLPTSSPTKESYSPAIQDRLASVRFEGAAPRRSPRSVITEVRMNLPTPEPSSQPHAHAAEPSPTTDKQVSTPSKAKPSENQVKIIDDDEHEEEDEIILPSSKRRKANDTRSLQTPTRRSTRLNSSDAPSSDLVTRSRNRGILSQITSSPPPRGNWDIGSPETSGDDEDVIITKPASRRRASKKVEIDDPFVVSDDDDRPVRRKNGPRSAREQADFVVDDDEIEYISSDEDIVPSAKQRRNSKARRRLRSKREQDELEDDLQDLQDSDNAIGNDDGSDNDKGITSRTRGGPVTTARDLAREQIELLKRRRAGEKIPEEESVDFEEIDGADLGEIGTETHFAAEDASSESDVELLRPAEVVEIDDEDDFVVDDEDTQQSHRPQSGIPLAFTSFASSKPKELFVHIVEWLVKNRIAPAFSRDDELYRLSWNKVNDQIKAQAGSRLISSAWNADFKNAVLARPNCKFTYISGGHDEFFLDCDACNRTNHPARYEFQFSGHAYHPDTLEPLDEDADDEDEEENEEGDDEANDKVSYDVAGHLLPTSARTFNLGRFCAANAEMGHKLTHWKYHLNESLLNYLDEQGVLSAEAILAREKLSKKKREKEAENIVDIMQETGVIQQLWRDLQNDLEDARFGMEDHVAKNGGKRNKQRIGKVRVTRPDGRIEEHSENGRMQVVIASDSEGE